MAEVIPTQLFVPGRGIESATSLWSGQVINGSPSSNDSYVRAVSAARYSNKNLDVDTILFSGAYSFALPPEQVPFDAYEASAMEAVANHDGLRDEVVTFTDIRSKSTYGNLLALPHFLDTSAPIGMVIHRDHVARAMKYAALVLPETTFIHIPVIGEEHPSQMPEPEQSHNDRIASLVYGAAMLGVKAGDRAKIEQRDLLAQTFVMKSLAAVRKITRPAPSSGLMKNEASQ